VINAQRRALCETSRFHYRLVINAPTLRMSWWHSGDDEAERSPEFDAIRSGPRPDENRMARIDFRWRWHPSLTMANPSRRFEMLIASHWVPCLRVIARPRRARTQSSQPADLPHTEDHPYRSARGGIRRYPSDEDRARRSLPGRQRLILNSIH
jgi:hypothetical protein